MAPGEAPGGAVRDDERRGRERRGPGARGRGQGRGGKTGDLVVANGLNSDVFDFGIVHTLEIWGNNIVPFSTRINNRVPIVKVISF